MFLGEALVLLIFFITKLSEKEGVNMQILEARSKGKIIDFSIFLHAIPAISDLITATLPDDERRHHCHHIPIFFYFFDNESQKESDCWKVLSYS